MKETYDVGGWLFEQYRTNHKDDDDDDEVTTKKEKSEIFSSLVLKREPIKRAAKKKTKAWIKELNYITDK